MFKFNKIGLYKDVVAFGKKNGKDIYEISNDMGLGNGFVWRLQNSNMYPSVTNLLIVCNHIGKTPAKYFTK